MLWLLALSRASPLPHFEIHSNVGAGLVAKAQGQTLKILMINPAFPAPAQLRLLRPYPCSSTH